MLVDLERYDGAVDVSTNVCIVGAGAAGITLALELDGSSGDVCVLESGQLQYDVETQALARGENVGLPYYDLFAARLRFLGGTTNHWAGICRPLEPFDFEARAAVPDSGWPITRAALEDAYRRAHEYCRLGEFNYNPAHWASDETPLLPLEDGPFRTSIKLERPVRFGTEYRDRLEASRNVRVFLSANVTEIEATDNAAAVRTVHARTLAGKALRISARVVILAAGGIENPRLLLASDGVQRSGLGNENDLVGRYFMEHPMVPAVGLQLANRHPPLGLYTGFSRDGLGVTGYFSLSPDVLRREGMLNVCASLDMGHVEQRIAKSLEGIHSAVQIWNSVKEGRLPPTFGEHLGTLLSDMNRVLVYTYERAFQPSPGAANLVLELEQAPNPSSRVLLSDEVDALGMRRVQLDWRLTDLERHTVRRFGELLALEAGRLGLGRVQLQDTGEDGWWAGQRGAWHHMGTTRMHSDPAKGVVDADCRVHGIDNLYIAGSSVFTTCGFANPTLTIVALAIRLADHLKGRLS